MEVLFIYLTQALKLFFPLLFQKRNLKGNAQTGPLSFRDETLDTTRISPFSAISVKQMKKHQRKKKKNILMLAPHAEF